LISLKGFSKEKCRPGLFKTHPTSEGRVIKLEAYLGEEGLTGETNPARTTRFKEKTKAL
jgi:hypothetical protein